MTYRYSDGGHEDPRLARAMDNASRPVQPAPIPQVSEPVQVQQQTEVAARHFAQAIPQTESVKSFFDIQLEMLCLLFEMIGSSDAGQSEFALSQVEIIYQSIVRFQKTKSGHYKSQDSAPNASATDVNQVQSGESDPKVYSPLYFRVAGKHSPFHAWHPGSAPPQ